MSKSETRTDLLQISEIELSVDGDGPPAKKLRRTKVTTALVATGARYAAWRKVLRVSTGAMFVDEDEFRLLITAAPGCPSILVSPGVSAAAAAAAADAAATSSSSSSSSSGCGGGSGASGASGASTSPPCGEMISFRGDWRRFLTVVGGAGRGAEGAEKPEEAEEEGVDGDGKSVADSEDLASIDTCDVRGGRGGGRGGRDRKSVV